MDSEPVHLSCWNQLLNDNFGYTVRWEEFAPNCVGVHERGTVEWLIAQRNPPVPFDDLWELYPRKKQLFRDRMLVTGAISDSVVDLLQELKSTYLLAVVTSSGRVEVEPILEAAGILPVIQTAVYGSDVRNLKPAPDPYLLACQRLGTTNALVIEDSAAGVASARAAGLEVLQISTQRELCPALKARLEE